MFSDKAMKSVAEGARKGTPVCGPFDIQILPLTSCNQTCVFCPLHAIPESVKIEHAPRFNEPPKIMEWNVFEKIVAGLKEISEVERVHFTGGEPLAHPRIADMVAELKANFSKVNIGVVTNGILLPKKADALIKAGVDKINVSLNAADAETYLKLSPGNRRADFDSALEGLKIFGGHKKSSKEKKELTLSCVLTRFNYNQVSNFLEIAENCGADSVTFIPLVPFEYEKISSNAKLAVSAQEFNIFIDSVKKNALLAAKKGIWLGYGGKESDSGVLSVPDAELSLSCYAGYAFCVFWPNGAVRQCCNCETVMGDILCQSLAEIWRSATYSEFRTLTLKKIKSRMKCSCEECGYVYENGMLRDFCDNVKR